MLQFQPQAQVAERPPCWGKSYTADSGCSSCMFRESCRDEVIRLTRQPAPAPNYQGAPQYYRPPQVQVPPPPPQARPFMPIPPPPQTIRQPVAPAMAPPPQYQAQPQPIQGATPSRIGVYGAIPDTMWGAVASVPPIFRPQMQGETFLSRLVKNVVLSLAEIFLRELMLAARQAIFPPFPRAASNQTVDVTPQKAPGVG